MAKDVAAKTSRASTRVSMSGTSRMGVVSSATFGGHCGPDNSAQPGFFHELLDHDVAVRRGASL